MGVQPNHSFLILSCLISLCLSVLDTQLCEAQWGKRGQEEYALRGASQAVKAKKDIVDGFDASERARTPEEFEEAAQSIERGAQSFEALGDDRVVGQATAKLARIRYEQGRYEEALSLCRKSIELARKTNDVFIESIMNTLMGRILHRLGKNREAETAYQDALETSTRASNVEAQGRALAGLATLQLSAGDHHRALENYGKAVGMVRSANNPDMLGFILNRAGHAYLALGQYDKAAESFEEARSATEKSGVIRESAGAHVGLATAYQASGRNDKAVEHLKKSQDLNVRIGNLRAATSDAQAIAVTYQDRGQYGKSVEAFKEALALARKARDRKLEALALNNLGQAYTLVGNYPSALECLQKSIEVARSAGQKNQESQSLISLGHVFFKWGKHDKAKEFFDKGLAIAEKTGDKKARAEALTQLGLMYCSNGQHKEALEALDRAKKIGEPIIVAGGSIDDLMGNLYLDMGDLQTAEKLIQKSGSDVSKGRLHLVKQQHVEAKPFYESLRESADKTGNVDNRFIAYTGLGLAQEGAGDLAPAADSFRKAIETVEELRAKLNLHERAEFYNVRIGGFLRTGPYEGIARVLMKMNKPTDSLKESEYAKARMFSEAISRRVEGRYQDIPEELMDKDLEVNERLTALLKQRQTACEKAQTEAIDALEPQIKQAKDDLASHVDRLRSEYPLFAATKYPSPMDLTKTAISPAEWVLAYDVTDHGLLIYLTKGKELVKGVLKPVHRAEIEQGLRGFLKALDVSSGGDDLTEKLKNFDFAAGKKLADLLVGEVMDALPEGAPLIVIPDDCLGVLPLEMLVLSDGGSLNLSGDVPQTSGARFFGDRNPLVYYQSITALTLARTVQDRKEHQERLLVIADPVFAAADPRTRRWSVQLANAETARNSSRIMAAMKKEGLKDIELERLPLTGDLAKSLSELYQDKSDVYVGLDASKDAFLTKIVPSLPSYRFIVFATHGFVDNSSHGMAEPMLVLSLFPAGTDGLLKAGEVMGLKMNASAVILVACQTGLGRQLSGEGTMGMGRSFQYAGARSVVMSMWSVAEASSMQLAQAFFKYLAQGRGKMEALKLARADLRNGGYDHPFFWAPFVLTGEAD
ncbi:MAG: tetratricopeptide repeat protein [Deltaproteobacteria bacterium]|nr:tetratricopeptide repeat protein [Deltaproteobacteria bacterium]